MRLAATIAVCAATASISVLSAQNSIRGTIVDAETGEGVAGANILVTGTDQGGITDERGQFEISWSGSFPVTLRVSHVAYVSREVKVTDSSPVTVSLTPTVLRGEQVTVVAERTRTQMEASAAMDIVELETIQRVGSRDVGSALRRVSSLYVDQSPSGRQTVSIRGSNADEVAVFLDGVKINSANTGVADLSQVDLYSLKKIEVIRGGHVYLFGQGNLGGVINLTSRNITENGLSVDWGRGLSFRDDIDLSLSAARVAGPFGVGGRFSGRTRAYGGRTLTASAFGNLSGDLRLTRGRVRARWYGLKNALTYPSGKVASGDEQMTSSLHYTGSLLRSEGWDMFAGIRQWMEVNNFFINMNQQLGDRNRLVRVGKSYHRGLFQGFVQMEKEDQRFTADRTVAPPGGMETVESHHDLSRETDGLVITTRWLNQEEAGWVDRFFLEISARIDRTTTTVYERRISVTKNPLPGDEGLTEKIGEKRERASTSLANRRLGMRMENVTGNLKVVMFAGMGMNHRLPPLNDLYTRSATTIRELREGSLKSEVMTSTEFNLELAAVDLPDPSVVSKLELKAAFFLNEYDDKVGYLQPKGNFEEPPVPFNEPRADIRGFEGSFLVSMGEGRMQIYGATTLLKVENPLLFPGKPGFRRVLACDLDFGFLAASVDYFVEGEQFVVGAGFGQLFEPRKNANLNIRLEKRLRGIDIALSYTVRNLLSTGKSGLRTRSNILMFNYYDQYRQILTLRATL